jgi:circadian clock protein KaiB
VHLFIAGASPNSVAAVAALRALIAEFAGLRIDMEIVDVLVDPQRALRARVLVTPMLLKVEPPPERRILGNLSDRRTLLNVLGLDEAARE